ncbi:MAG TPA: DUF2339 domain-containing protein [Prosthecobacter sp.]|nr:DUF2339 domain-containing protein [Prosthecobacter sp.]
MDFLLFFGFIILAFVFVLPIIAIVIASGAKRKAEELEAVVTALRAQIQNLRPGLDRRSEAPPAVSAPVVAPAPVATPAPDLPPPSPFPAVFAPLAEPQLPPPSQAPSEPQAAPASAPPPVAQAKPRALPAVSLEQFLGVKLFAWVGGLALFLGIVFFVKYAFERNLISPALRTVIGYVIGAGLVGAGIRMRETKVYQVLAQTLAATGVLILYGVTYAAHELYHFPAFGTFSTFAYLSVITAGAFFLAVRMNAQVIAVLGMAGGFLTPIFVNTGRDNPFGLFSYILLLDVGLIMVARNRRWFYLILCAAGGTLLMQAGWLGRFFHPGRYAFGNAVWIPITIHLLFPALFAAATAWLRRRDPLGIAPAVGGLASAAWSLVVAFLFLVQPAITSRPLILFGFLFAINALVLLQIWLQPRVAPAQWLLAFATFLHLAWWSHDDLTQDTLVMALLAYLLFGLMHTGFALAALRRHPAMAQSQRQGVWLGPAATLLTLIPILSLPSVPWLVWPAILLLNLMTLAVAAAHSRLSAVFASLGVTLLGLALWLYRLPASGEGLFGFLFVLGSFAALFAAAGFVLTARLGPGSRGALPIASAVLPFLLLILATLRLSPADPSPLFGLGLLLAGFLLFMSGKAGVPALTLVALCCMTALEYVWYATSPGDSPPWLQLGWFIGIAATFGAYPMMLRARDELLWKVSAMAWVVAFPPVYDLMESLLQDDFMGLVPAAFALPAFGTLLFLLRQPPAKPPLRQTQLAWFGGVTLLFITLIIPIQLDKEWITVGWALEGAALCWLYTRVPHDGLRKVGVSLLVTSFVRLALNPAVLTYHPRTGTPVWNWFLYTYGVAALAQFAAAYWLAPPRDRMGEINVRAMAWSFGVILLFLLLNLEIADYFTAPGQQYVLIEFGGHFARSMTYSIAWALFALALLVIGFRTRTPAARYAGIGLMGVTLLKLFLNDLANIGSIYRIGALIVVALIALGASFLYQRFYNREGGGN